MSKTEKITVNLSVVDLGKIDLLVQEGFYSNRTDFVRTAIRNQMSKHQNELNNAVKRWSGGVGIMGCSRQELEKAIARGEKLTYAVIGMLVIEKDVTPELALQAIQSIRVWGILKAEPTIKAALADIILT